MKGNLIGFHTYPLVEPAVWVGKKENVLPGGNITGGSYSTRWATTLEEGHAWGYQEVNTSSMGFGASQIFEHDCFGHPTVSGDPKLCPYPKTDDDNDEVFNRVGQLWKTTFAHAKALGIQTVLGTEIPLSIPKSGVPPSPSPPPNPGPGPAPPVSNRLPLQVWYSKTRSDHFVTTTDCTECLNLYTRISVTGWVYSGNVTGSTPLCTYYDGKSDNMLAACTETPPKGYSKVRVEGYAPPGSSSSSSSSSSTSLLNQWMSSDQQHHWAADSDWAQNATAAGFTKESGAAICNVFTTGPPIPPAPPPPSPPPLQDATPYYEGIFTRLEELLGDTLTYYWGWTPEGWEWSRVAISNPLIQDAVRDVQQMQAAHDAVKPSFGLASCGWTVGPLGARWYYDTVLPPSWTISSIDMDVGNTPVDPAYENITHRPAANKWTIPWYGGLVRARACVCVLYAISIAQTVDT